MRKKIVEMTGSASDGHVFFDFGKAAYAQLELELDGRTQDLVQVVISEYAENNKAVHTTGWRTFKIDNFRIMPDKKVYRFSIPVHSGAYGGFPHVETPAEFGGEVAIFRYVEVNHYHGPVTVRRIEFYNDAPEDAAAFESSNAKLDQVWDFCKYSILATSIFPCYVDGERERMPYEGDAYITELSHFCCGADYSIAENTIDHFMAHGDKTWPTEWLLVTPFLVQNFLLYSGKKKPFERWLPALGTKTLPNMCRKDGLLVPIKPVTDIVDWPETCRDGYEFGETNFVPNAFRYGALLVMHELTGDESYARIAADLKATLRRTMMKNGIFVDNPSSSHTGLHTAMFALRFGLAESDEIARHQAIIRDRGMRCSVYGAQFLLEACFENGLDDLGVKLMTDDGLCSWMNMMRCGSTVTMECWDNSLKPNQDWSHPWGSAPANIIPRYVVGVRPTAPGFEKFVVKPSHAAPGRFFLRQPTPFGAIEVHKEKEKVQVTLTGTDRKLSEIVPGEYCVD